MSNFSWDLMVFELSGNRLNEFGARTVVEQNLKESGHTLGESKQYTILSDRLYTPTVMERFAAL